MDSWMSITQRAALASHRLIGWIYWDPTAIANYAALGVPNGAGYYIVTRGAALAPAGNSAVTAAFGSIHPFFVGVTLDLCRTSTTFANAEEARNQAVVQGLREFTPELCDGLGELAGSLWSAADSLPISGRVLYGALRDRPRPDDPLLSAWLAVNCIREWRGDTHWAINVAEDLSGTMAGILDGAWRNYADDWLPRSRGSDDAALASAIDELSVRGFVTEGRVNDAGIAYRQGLEDRLDRICVRAWQAFGQENIERFLALVEPVAHRLVERIDATAGPLWMPAARNREPQAPAA
jgi:hypothetical protein